MEVHMHSPRKPGNVYNACHAGEARTLQSSNACGEKKLPRNPPQPPRFRRVCNCLLTLRANYLHVDRDGYSCFCCFVLFQGNTRSCSVTLLTRSRYRAACPRTRLLNADYIVPCPTRHFRTEHTKYRPSTWVKRATKYRQSTCVKRATKYRPPTWVKSGPETRKKNVSTRSYGQTISWTIPTVFWWRSRVFSERRIHQRSRRQRPGRLMRRLQPPAIHACCTS